MKGLRDFKEKINKIAFEKKHNWVMYGEMSIEEYRTERIARMCDYISSKTDGKSQDEMELESMKSRGEYVLYRGVDPPGLVFMFLGSFEYHPKFYFTSEQLAKKYSPMKLIITDVCDPDSQYAKLRFRK